MKEYKVFKQTCSNALRTNLALVPESGTELMQEVQDNLLGLDEETVALHKSLGEMTSVLQPPESIARDATAGTEEVSRRSHFSGSSVGRLPTRLELSWLVSWLTSKHRDLRFFGVSRHSKLRAWMDVIVVGSD